MSTFKELTNNEKVSFKGIFDFLQTNPVMYGNQENRHFVPYDIEDFCLKGYNLYSGLYDFLSGRFNEDGGLAFLTEIFNSAIKSNPDMAKNYFYIYSQLVQLIGTVNSSEQFITHFYETFRLMAEKVDLFEQPSIVN